MKRDEKLLGLELLRFSAAAAVLFSHYQHFAYVVDRPVGFVSDEQPFYSVFRLFYEFGWLGVPVFWCISGFIFFWKYGPAISSKTISAGRFFILRFSRLYPLHLLTLLLVAGLQYAWDQNTGRFFVYQNNDAYHFTLQLFMASNWFSKDWSFNAPVWSVSVEVLVYAVFFLALRRWPLVRTAVVALALGLAAKLLGINEYQAIPCAAYFFAGCLTAYYAPRLYKYRVVALVAGALTAAALFQVRPIAGFLVMLPVSLLVLSSISLPKWSRRPIELAGNLTYSSYLLHFPVQLALMLLLRSQGLLPDYREPLLLFVFMGVTLALAGLSYQFFEVPVQRIIRRWRPPSVATVRG